VRVALDKDQSQAWALGSPMIIMWARLLRQRAGSLNHAHGAPFEFVWTNLLPIGPAQIQAKEVPGGHRAGSCCLGLFAFAPGASVAGRCFFQIEEEEPIEYQ